METNFVCHLMLDVSASMRYGEEREQKLLYAAQMATTLGYSIVRQSDKVSLATFDERVLRLRAAQQLDGPGRAHDQPPGRDRAGRRKPAWPNA